MEIQVLSVTSETVQGPRGAYNVVEVAYKNLTFQGKVESKKLMPFGAGKNTAITMANAKPAEVYDIEVIKNDKGYNDWVKATKGSAHVVATAPAGTASSSAPASATTKGGWETPEERAKKQVYIIRQSSLSTAVAALTAAGKTVPPVTDVIKYARELESYVFGQDTDSVVGQDVGSIEELDEDPIVF